MGHPWHCAPIVEANDQLHIKGHAALDPLHDADQIGVLIARRHEVDHPRRAGFRDQIGDENEGAVAIGAPRLDHVAGANGPVAIVPVAQQPGETGR